MNEPRKTVELVALIILFTSITAFTVFGFLSREWLPTVASVHGAGVDDVIRYLTLTTGTILIIGTIIFVVFLWKYGRGADTGSPATTQRTERRWTLVPIIGMAFVAEAGVLVKGLPVWEQVYGEVPEDALVVEVTAQQFEWIVRHPGPDGEFGRTEPTLVNQSTNPAGIDPNDAAGADDIVIRNNLHIPVDRPMYLRLRARDVLHSFSVPAFRVKQDIVPGMTGSTQFIATEVGTFEIACAELCGAAHYRMRGSVIVHNEQDYENWVASGGGAQ